MTVLAVAQEVEGCCLDAMPCEYCGQLICPIHDDDTDDCYGRGTVHRGCHDESGCRQHECYAKAPW